MKPLKIFFLGITLLIIGGCASTQSLDVEERTRSYGGVTKTQYIQSAINYFNEEGMPIDNIDRELGIVNTDYIHADAWESAMLGDSRTKINLSISETEQGVRVVANMVYERKETFGGWRQASLFGSTARSMYDDVFEGIEKYLK